VAANRGATATLQPRRRFSTQPLPLRRLSELAASMQWSASRLSHHVSRMEQRGLVVRTDCDSDGRGAFVVLTPAGYVAIEQAAPGHVASVRRHLIDLLTPEQLAALTDIGENIIDHFGEQRPAFPTATPASR